MPPAAVPVTLTTSERKTLKKKVRGSKTPWRDRLRAQIVLTRSSARHRPFPLRVVPRRPRRPGRASRPWRASDAATALRLTTQPASRSTAVTCGSPPFPCRAANRAATSPSSRPRRAAYFRFGNSAARFEKIRSYSRMRMALFISKRKRRSREFGWSVVAYQSPDQLGLITLSGIVVDPRPFRDWRGKPNAGGERRR
jgi:hypothetical protein